MITGIVIALVGYRIALPLAEKLPAGRPRSLLLAALGRGGPGGVPK